MLEQIKPKRIRRGSVYNNDGLRLTKAGKIDGRSLSSKRNLEKSRLYQAIKTTKEKEYADFEAEFAKIKKEVQTEPEIYTSDSELDEYVEEEYGEPEDYILKPKGQPQVIEKIVEVQVERIVPDERVVAQLNDLKRKHDILINKARELSNINRDMYKSTMKPAHWRMR
jgi:hypothetical protein